MRLITKLIISFLLAGLASPLLAVTREDFEEERFYELKDAGEVILVDIFANWCPTCARQREILDQYQEKHPDAPLHILTVNYNTQRDWVRHFEATRQSTFILYNGNERTWMSVAETDKDRIFARLNEALDT